MPPGVIEFTPSAFDGPDFSWSLFQLIVQNIDSRAAACPGDLPATLAILAGRIIQRATFREQPDDFRPDRSANGVAFLRCDRVSEKLAPLSHGALAATLMEASLVSGARRLPEFSRVKQDAQEAMHRRGAVELRGTPLSASPLELAAEVQGDIDGLLSDPSNRSALVRASIQACGYAIGYQRNRLCPAEAAELALSVALYGGWLDQRESPRK